MPNPAAPAPPAPGSAAGRSPLGSRPGERGGFGAASRLETPGSGSSCGCGDTSCLAPASPPGERPLRRPRLPRPHRLKSGLGGLRGPALGTGGGAVLPARRGPALCVWGAHPPQLWDLQGEALPHSGDSCRPPGTHPPARPPLGCRSLAPSLGAGGVAHTSVTAGLIYTHFTNFTIFSLKLTLLSSSSRSDSRLWCPPA